MRLGWPRFFPLSLPLPPDAPPDSEVSQQDPLPGSALPLCSPITSAGVLPAPAFGQHFSVLIVMLALRLFFEASFRFRVVGQTLRVLAEVGASPLPMPCFHSVRLWVLRIGLYRLQNPCLGPRWALICDHTATYSGLKLFVICGVDLDKLDARLADGSGNFNLSQRDVQPLAIVPMPYSNAELLLEQYLKCIQLQGRPEWMITDGGSDITKSVRLLQAHQVAAGEPPTKHTYDLSHRIARIVQHELEELPAWQQLEARVSAARTYCKYRARHLSPPSLLRGPDRWMNLEGIIKWFAAMLELKEQQSKIRTASSNPSIETNMVTQTQRPRFGLTKGIWESAKAQHQKRDGVFYALADLCGKEYHEAASYERELSKQCAKIPSKVMAHLMANSDLNAIYLRDIMAGSEQEEGIHEEVRKALGFSHRVQKYLKGQGLTREGMKQCEGFLAEAEMLGIGQSMGEQILEALRQMGKELNKEEERIIVSSDVIESLNGSWKMLISGSPTPGLGVNALLMPGLMGEPSPEEIKTALATVSVADVTVWRQENFGETFYQARRGARPSKTTKVA